MQYPESTSVAVVQAWPEPGSLKPRGGHHLEPQGSRAYSSAVPRVISFCDLTCYYCLLNYTPSVCERLAYIAVKILPLKNRYGNVAYDK